ncbi:ATP-dependent helicase [Hoeflea sp. EC-HK425]|uniref:ATP-dependent helicase n=1 Tax=Hoeflea sp. EC-HK425 TaxID=2038388 RepID=UPI00125218AE|nr:ATP-dependent helicase [Hoeflea sp. EC-HK425]VVT12194.1 conserved hypothetical protein [Hoeflea sp. EC-HK425]
MPFRGFEGPAGTGKTHRLIEEVGQHLIETSLDPHQRVLALTFMHGSRKRLDTRFGATPALRGKAVCMTIDSFAQSVLQRWSTLSRAKAIAPDGFDQVCDSCGQLLEDPTVANWVARTFPVVVVDEAQELKPVRLRILRALAPHVSLYVAADEFQCLDEGVDTEPFRDWFNSGRVETLNIVHRTNQRGLLDAGLALRSLCAPVQGPGLRIRYEFKNVMPFAIASTLYRARGSSALIYGPAGRAWADEIIARAAKGMRSAGYGEIPAMTLIHEDRNQEEKEAVLGLFQGPEAIETAAILRALNGLESPPPWIESVRSTVIRTEQTQGLTDWQPADLAQLVERKAAQHRAYGYHRTNGISVMSIHQAKNRQFDNVVLLWPPGVPGSDEQKCRLLYNGITRAARNCSVFVRVERNLREPPFGF